MYPGYYHHDSWDVRLPPPSPPPDAGWHHPYRHSGHLSPEPAYHSNLHRSHSQGHVPRGGANIHIHNQVPVDAHIRAEARGPPVQAPMPPQMVPPMMAAPQPMFIPVYPPEQHTRGRLGEEFLWEELENMKLNRSRSRGRTTGDRPDNSDWYRWELKQKEKEATEASQKRHYEAEKARIKTEYELKASEEENKRRIAEAEAAADAQRLISDYERKKREDAQKAADAEEAFKLKLERQAQETRDREKKAHEDFLRKQREQEEEEERKYQDYLRRQKEKEEEEARKYQEFLRKQRDKQEAEEKLKKEEEEKVQATMRQRLEKLGYSAQAIEIMINPDKEKKRKKERRHSHSPGGGAIVVVPPKSSSPGAMVVSEGRGHVPVFPRINRAYLDVETLDHYKVPWEFDRANPDFLIVLREMDKYETDVLFEHTARRRKNVKLLIEDTKKKEPKFAWVRRRGSDRSKSRGRDGRDLRVMEIRRT